MDEVWYPAGGMRWIAREFTPTIQQGVEEALAYYESRTPIQLTETDSINLGGLATQNQLGVLEIRYSEGIFNCTYGGQTKHYRKPKQGNRMVKISFEQVKGLGHARRTMAHEMGHVLGFTHEFQRWDRGENGVRIGVHLDHFYNYEKPDKKNVRVLSPYDFRSRYAANYDGVTPTPRAPAGLLSARDINSIYRVYGRPLGGMQPDLLYGEEAASADFDGDRIDDLAIAAQYSEGGSNRGAIYFYKGVEQAPGEDGTGTTYVPWFRETIVFAASQDRKIVLTTGDTHRLTRTDDVVSTVATGDGISELLVGLPGAGRVEIWVINSEGRFADDLGTVGGHGVGRKIVIRAVDVGITGRDTQGFGSSLAMGRFFAGDGDDLAIGAPKAATFNKATSSRRVTGQDPIKIGGPAVYLLPDADPARAAKIANPARESDSEFGESLAVMESFDHGHDTLVVGAPGAGSNGEVFVFRRANLGPSDVATAPHLVDSFTGGTTGSRFGAALAAFTTREDGSPKTEHWIAVGAPKATVSGVKRGEAALYSFKLSGDRSRVHRLSGRGGQEGMNFGQSIAVHRGECTSRICPKESAWLAIGSPRAIVNGKKTGQVHLWDVWSGGQVNRSVYGTWGGPNEDARYGQDVVAVRGTQKGGGFLVLAKKGELTIVRPGSAGSMMRIRTGLAQVRLNKQGANAWSSWTRTLGPNTAGDKRPANLR